MSFPPHDRNEFHSFGNSCVPSRVGNSIIHLLSELLVFCNKKNKANERCPQFLVSDLGDLFKVAIFGERPERFAHGYFFLVSNLSDSLIVALLS